jgi:hypothetical protein
MKITLAETSRRTIRMLADFLHRKPSELQLGQNLRKKWKMTDKDLEVLEIWIEGPISASLPGFFQDVQADAHVDELQDEDTVSTISSLVDYIWANLPDSSKAE